MAPRAPRAKRVPPPALRPGGYRGRLPERLPGARAERASDPQGQLLQGLPQVLGPFVGLHEGWAAGVEDHLAFRRIFLALDASVELNRCAVACFLAYTSGFALSTDGRCPRTLRVSPWAFAFFPAVEDTP